MAISGFKKLFQRLRAEASSGRVGRPVLVRGSLELSADHGRLTVDLARGLAEAFRWLGDEPVEVYAAGSAAAGQVTALARGRSGTAALLSTALLRRGTPRVRLLVLGSRGSLRHDGDLEAHEPGTAADAADDDERLGGREKAIFDAVEESLSSGAPRTPRPAEKGEKKKR